MDGPYGHGTGGGLRMIEITVEPSMCEQLQSSDGPVRVRDESGRTLGHFLPGQAYDELLYRALAAGTPFSPDEMRAAFEDPGPGRPLAAIWKSLGRT